jgi:hypothetical protein
MDEFDFALALGQLLHVLPFFVRGFEMPRSTHTQPSVPIHFVPARISLYPPAMVMAMSSGYLSSMRYLVHVFQTASRGGNSPWPSISSGPRCQSPKPQWAMSQ